MMKEREMNEFRKRWVLLICILGGILSIIFGIRQIAKDQESENIGYAAVSWDVPKIPYYSGGRVYRTSSSQGSTLTMPRVTSSSQQLFHHHAGGTYAGQGMGTYRSSYAQASYRSNTQSTGQPVHTFSNGAIYSYGGSGSGGGMTGVTSHRKVSYNGGSVGYTTPSISISMPRTRSYAYNSIQGTSSETSARPSMPGRRKVAPAVTGDEEEGDVGADTEVSGLYWMWNGEKWESLEGKTKVEGGILYRWDGSAWVFVQDQVDPDTPIGDVPWLLMLLVAGGYIVLRRGVAFRQIKTV